MTSTEKIAFFIMFLRLGVVEQGCGCGRPNLGAAGGSAAPSSSSPPQVILSDFARCVYSLHPFCAMCVALRREWCVCMCVFAQLFNSPPLHVCVLVFLPLCGITADYSSIEHWVLHPQLE